MESLPPPRPRGAEDLAPLRVMISLLVIPVLTRGDVILRNLGLLSRCGARALPFGEVARGTYG
jgi:hypothetical protein